MKLFMAIPDRINFLQLGRYGRFSEQTYRSLFENETFDWFAFNDSIISKHLTGKRKAIAIDPSYIPKSGKKTPWIGYFWSGCAGDYKRGLEILGIGVIDIDNHDCMTLGSIQTPDCKTLDNMGKNLVDWYSSYLISKKDKIQSISRTVVADAFFSKETFITPMCENDFHVISRFRNDVILYYPTLEKKTGKRGHPKWFDGRIDFANLDLTRCKEYEVNKGKLYGLRVYAKALKRYVSLSVWYPMDGRTDKWQLYFSTDDSMDGREVLDYYRTRFQLEFCFYDKYIIMQSKVRSTLDNQRLAKLLLTSTSHNINQCPRSLSQSRRSLLFSHSLSEVRFGTRSAYAFSRASRFAFESALA